MLLQLAPRPGAQLQLSVEGIAMYYHSLMDPN